jgi:hypothetical protein
MVGPCGAYARAESRQPGKWVANMCRMQRSAARSAGPGSTGAAERPERMVELLELAKELGAVGSICVPVRRPLHFPDLSPVFASRGLVARLAAKMLAHAAKRTKDLKALGAAGASEPL